MKRILAIGMGIFVAMMFSGVAFCQDGPYVSAHLGHVILQDSDYSWSGESGTLDFDPGFAFGIAGGYKFKQFRIEGELGVQANDIDTQTYGGTHYYVDGDVSNNYCLGNVYFDFANKSPITPYVSAGIGFSRIDIDIHDAPIHGDGEDIVFAYQFGVGVGYTLNRNFVLDLKYRYFATSDPDLDGLKSEYKSHNIYFGVRYNF